MEFEELQAIWDTQNNRPLYAINEKALHNRIIAKKHQVTHIARISEWLLIIANIASGGIILWNNISTPDSVFLYILAAWMFGSALYVLINHIRRIRGQHRFDRSMLGDLKYAIATASYQVRLSWIMRWNMLPVAILILLSLWETTKPLWIILAVSLFFIFVFHASGWEHNIYKAKKRELEGLLKKLQQE